MEVIAKIFQYVFFFAIFVFAVLLFAQQTKIMWDTHNMSDEEFRKYVKDNNLL